MSLYAKRVAAFVISGAFALACAAAQPSATIEKPKARTVSAGFCKIPGDGTFTGNWGPSALPTLAFTIGPGATMADQMHASKVKYNGPGRYTNEIIAVYLGKTALEDSYGGLGTVTIAADGHSGTFVLNDGKASGRFDCGTAPVKQ
ncbi:MAG TPA: hypothetical protein VG345_13290 [Bryobacteraceae bacterium]|nr:hypothetical protein [Bryobacteraceae bacterium]